MLFHVMLTTECDLQCRYCYGKACEDIESDFPFNVDYSMPRNIDYHIDKLAAFCKKDPNCVLCFYGGEPLLRLEELRTIMDTIKAEHLVIQTNGLHLDELESCYTNRFHSVLVSIDGEESLTDYYRGEGVYRRVVDNLKYIRRNGFEGEVVARMTVMEETDIARQVKWLLNNTDFSFSSVHWQLDAGFWKNDFAKRPFEKWVNENYNPGIQHLVRFWVDQMEKTGKVLRLYPLLGIMESMLHGETSLLRCGSGWVNYTIQTNGYIVPCPAMSGMKDYYLGHISSTNPTELEKISVSQPCSDCRTKERCGGRCLYANITKRWNEEAYAVVCTTVRNLIRSLEREKPRVERLISLHNIGLSDFGFLKYSGCEIIP